MLTARMSHPSVAVALVILVLPWICVAVECDAEPVNTDARLRKDLFCRYDKFVDPVKKFGTHIEINLMLVVKAFNYNDDTNQLDLASWMAMSWTDEFLRWSPAAYDGIRSIVVSDDLVWQPDISGVPMHGESMVCRPVGCVLDHNGTVQCIPPCRHTAFCVSDYLRWPFDTQNCSLPFSNWLHDSGFLEFVVLETQIAADLFSQNRKWRMLQTSYTHDNGWYMNYTSPLLQYAFLLERHSAVHAMVLLAPAVVLVTINLLTLWLSPCCVERMALVSGNVFCHFMYLQLLSWLVPRNGVVVPLVVRFFETSLWLTVVLVALAVVSRGFSESRAVVPDWIGASIHFVDRLRLVENATSRLEETTTDGVDATAADLSHRNGQLNGKKRTVAQAWRPVVRLIDGGLFVVLALVYGLMMFEWLPEGFLTGQTNRKGLVP